MKDFEHLISVWQEQPKQPRLSVDDVLKQVKKGINKLGSRVLYGIIAISVTIIFTAGLTLFAVFERRLSYIGLFVLLFGMIAYLILQIGDYRTITRQDLTLDPAAYLNSLKEYQKRRAYLHGRFYYAFALMTCLGISFYTIEVFQNKPLMFKVTYYIFCAIYILFCTFYLKDRFIQREQKRVSYLIERLERLEGQFE
ncbi:hypothetical protein LLH06_09995 [Mucilaginibacter daejeonensis]|uniref:hypothetical protein n=1 Tax=Mucilaginibacter daejeonensis TaxID=398049 RepID=UPI001D179252|nr:hypothetical protein [Mucilaginibacter daejeonensis]UEG55290.1 hypothetical protein LLH06_09995 [Mucilaginibacter daejeonensis]